MKRALPFLLLLLIACEGEGPTDPRDAIPRGRLSGIVTLNPAQMPSAFTARKVLVFDEARTRQLFTVDVDLRGLYVIDLPPGRYTIDFRGESGDRTSDLPTVVTIQANVVTVLNLTINV